MTESIFLNTKVMFVCCNLIMFSTCMLLVQSQSAKHFIFSFIGHQLSSELTSNIIMRCVTHWIMIAILKMYAQRLKVNLLFYFHFPLHLFQETS